MAVVAGYFDSEADATQAMDQILMRSEFADVDSEVISTVARGTGNPGDSQVGVAPIFPQTSGGLSGSGVGGVPVTGGGGGRRLFDDLSDDEASYFSSALDGGGVLALIRVSDRQAAEVRRILSSNGARVYQED